MKNRISLQESFSIAALVPVEPSCYNLCGGVTSMAYDFQVRSKQDLIDAIEDFGIVPYFSTRIPGFSLQEHCPPELLFSDDGNDTWSWKGPVIRETGCIYAKLFDKKAAYIRRDLYLDLANYRRDGYDFDARWDEGLVRAQDKQLYDLIEANAPVLSKELRRQGGYEIIGRWKKTEGKKGFDSSINRLQEQCYVIVRDFVYTVDSKGIQRGWGVAQYTTPELEMGEDFIEKVYQCEPAESYERLFTHLRSLFPDAPEKDLQRLLK